MATNSVAMTLGQHRGTAFIGQPLDISVPAVFDAQEGTIPLCLEADVFYADTRVQSSRVQVTAEKFLSGSSNALIRIRSPSAVDEPVVSFYLRMGCLQKIEKRYVVLAEPAPEAALLNDGPLVTAVRLTAPVATASGVNASQALSRSPSSPLVPLVRSRPVAGSTGAVLDPDVQRADVALRARKDFAPAEGRKNQIVKVAEFVTPSTNSMRNKARLQLAPLDLSGSINPPLQSTAELASLPDASPQQRLAAAALWRALSLQPEEILRDADKLLTLENNVRSLQLQSQKNLSTLDALNDQLLQAKSDRYAYASVFTLGGLIFAAFAVLIYFLRRRFLAGDKGLDDLPWWRKNEAFEKGWAGGRRDAEWRPSPEEVAERRTGETRLTESGLDLDLDLGVDLRNDAGQATKGRPMSRPSQLNATLPQAGRDRSDFGLSQSQPERAVKAEELFDVQQQADFFVSLGQHEQAIQVLRHHIDENLNTSALVYLDLFNLYHQLKCKADYEVLRGSFNQLFNANIPAFDFYNDNSLGLQAYPAALTRIEALWSSPKVLEVIEESIFRRPDSGAEAFDLEAYRELLLLYAVARAVNHSEGTSASDTVNFDLPEVSLKLKVKHSNFPATSIQPLSARVAKDEKHHHLPMLELVLPATSQRPELDLNLDLDLTQCGSASDSVHSGTESDAGFFAQFAADIPVGPSVSALPTGAAATTGSSLSNLFDFDAFDASFEQSYQAKLPKV